MSGQIEPEGGRALFRILLRFASHDSVVDEAWCSYRSAIARVGRVVQQHTGERPSAIVLQQRLVDGRPSRPAAFVSGGGVWVVRECWGAEVIERICRQRVDAARQEHAPSPIQAEVACTAVGVLPRRAPAEAVRGRGANRRESGRPGHRWETGVGVGLAAGAWLALAGVLTGGRVSELLGFATPPSAAVATELPFTGPATPGSAALPEEIASIIGIDG